MRHVARAVCLLLAGCFGGTASFDSNNPELLVCVQGDAGGCCVVMIDLCTAVDEGCTVGGRAPRPLTRCLSCWEYELEDGGIPAAPGAPPPPPRNSDGEIDNTQVEVCGPAEYRRY